MLNENNNLNTAQEARDLLKEAVARLNITVTDTEISKFLEYKDLLISWNKKINLTSITDEKEIILKHFADSLSVLPFIGKNDKVIDIGTGAGFPGLPLKIVTPGIALTLLDSLNKRIIFLSHVVDKLALENVSMIHGRAETLGHDDAHREMYDISLSRAVAPLNIICEYCLPFVKKGGAFLAMKGANAESEIKEAQRAIELLGGEIASVKSFDISAAGIESVSRTIIKISKVNSTPIGYPRKDGIPSKRPL